MHVDLVATLDSEACASSHSLIAFIALIRVSEGEEALRLNRSLFLAVQMNQEIHGNRFPETPTGGRFFVV